MRLSHACAYALLALGHLVTRGGKPVASGTIVEARGLPQ